MTEEMFLCSHCRTEQSVREMKEFSRKYIKSCVCPNCKEVCCKDYCFFFHSGKWYPPECTPPDEYYPFGRTPNDEEQQAAWDRAVKEYEEIYAKFNQEYKRTRKEYGISD